MWLCKGKPVAESMVSDCRGDSWRLGICYSFLILGRQCTNMLSVKYTNALFSQVATQLGPFLVAPIAKIFLPSEALPRYLLPALVCSFIGALLVIGGQAHAMPSGLTDQDGVGLTLAFTSLIFSACMRVYMKWSSAGLSKASLMSWGYTNGFTFLLFAGWSNPDAWQGFAHMSSETAIAVLIFTVIILIFANLAQVACVRNLGPAMASSFQPLRLASTVFGSYLVLNEPVQRGVVWLGLALIAIVLAAFSQAQVKKPEPPQEDTREAPADYAPLEIEGAGVPQQAAGCEDDQSSEDPSESEEPAGVR